MVGKTDFKENPKSYLDLDLGFVNSTANFPDIGDRQRAANYQNYTIILC